MKEHHLNLSNNISEMMAKVMAIDLECSEYHDDDQDSENINTENQNQYQCEQCGYKCGSEMTLHKHINTKNPLKITQPESENICYIKWSLCDDICKNSKELADHIEEGPHSGNQTTRYK